jgi:hypothetical protein
VQQQHFTKFDYFDDEANQQVYCAKVVGPDLSERIDNFIKDAVSNLRDALDHATYESAVAINGGRPSKTGFPFGSNADAVNKALKGKNLKDNPHEIRWLLADFLPYEGGNDILWALNRIRNVGTHRFIVSISSAVARGPITLTRGIVQGGSVIGTSIWNELKRELEYTRLAPGSTVSQQVDFSMSVVFEEIDAVTGKEVISTLNQMASEIERVISLIEIETINILPKK